MLYFQRKSLSLESALSYLQAFTSNSHEFLWKRSSLFQHYNSLCEVNVLLFHFLNAVLSEKITILWKCFKLLTSIHQQLSCITMKEKQSVPTLQFNVRSEWSVASLSTCCCYRDNHFFLKLPLATYKHSTATHMPFSEREAVCSNTSIHSAKWTECCFTF